MDDVAVIIIGEMIQGGERAIKQTPILNIPIGKK
jgi:hypothetical protein